MNRTGLNSPLWITNWPQAVWLHVIFWTLATIIGAGPTVWLWMNLFEP